MACFLKLRLSRVPRRRTQTQVHRTLPHLPLRHTKSHPHQACTRTVFLPRRRIQLVLRARISRALPHRFSSRAHHLPSSRARLIPTTSHRRQIRTNNGSNTVIEGPSQTCTVEDTVARLRPGLCPATRPHRLQHIINLLSRSHRYNRTSSLPSLRSKRWSIKRSLISIDTHFVL
jgi:hypothetical protein